MGQRQPAPQAEAPETVPPPARADLVTRLRTDTDFLELVSWARERHNRVEIDENAWLSYARVAEGFSSSGMLSIDNVSSWLAFKAEFAIKQLEMRKLIEEANARKEGGLLRILSPP